MLINKTRIMLGGALLVIGLLSLLNNLEIFHLSEEYVLSLIFAGTGVVLMQHGSDFFSRHTKGKSERQWTFYLGSALVIVGAIIFIAEARFLPDEMIATMWLWLIAGILYRVYQRDMAKNWWVLLFAGPMFTVGAVVLLEGFRLLRGDMMAVLIILGIAGTFAYIYALRSPQRKNDWAKFPAVVFFLIAVFILLANEFRGAIPFAISSLFILTGLYMIYRTVRADFGSKPDQPNSSAELPQVS